MNEMVKLIAEKCPFFGAPEEYEEIKNADSNDPEFLTNQLENTSSVYQEVLHCFELIDTGVSEAIIRSGLNLNAAHFLSSKNKPWIERLFEEISELEDQDEEFIVGFMGEMLKTYNKLLHSGVCKKIVQEVTHLSDELCEEIACAKPADV